ncbi:MAG: hypothetical protein JWP27_2881, partial [Flaviaesturariibacter sp.]|nr:hypothetical protein [Flaviaesturariibacter sp.]
MEHGKRDLLLLLKINSLDQTALNHQVECLHSLLVTVECNDVFCKSHELATRTRITNKPRKILKAVSFMQLRPFE